MAGFFVFCGTILQWSLSMASGCTHILFCWSSHPLALDEEQLNFKNMFNNHFIKRLFYFVLIIALGAGITLLAGFLNGNKDGVQNYDTFDS